MLMAYSNKGTCTSTKFLLGVQAQFTYDASSICHNLPERCYYPHLTDEHIEAQRGYATCPRLSSSC